MILFYENYENLIKILNNNNFIPTNERNLIQIMVYHKSDKKLYSIISSSGTTYYLDDLVLNLDKPLFDFEPRITAVIKILKYHLNIEELEEKYDGGDNNISELYNIERANQIYLWVGKIQINNEIKATCIYSENNISGEIYDTLTSDISKFMKCPDTSDHEKDLFNLMKISRII
ncbi:hypothetical protein TCON_0834 [Astathelohania contejeani]|uniref:Gelsolin-like domain-containing protein n=1 Tax=Astathelohania contejeani TaxID=164912 RepID=A0ABQ7I0U2_9MICR|nr:hypothetical protein TCON_0834 [Thelohania contejeani]